MTELLSSNRHARDFIRQITEPLNLRYRLDPSVKFYLILRPWPRYIYHQPWHISHSIGPEADSGFVKRVGPHFFSSHPVYLYPPTEHEHTFSVIVRRHPQAFLSFLAA